MLGVYAQPNDLRRASLRLGDVLKDLASRPAVSAWLARAGAGYIAKVSTPARWLVKREGDSALAGPGILCFWHGDLLLLGALSKQFPGAATLVSRSRDGGLATEILHTLGHPAIRASRARRGKAGKGGMEGLAAMATHLEGRGWLAIAPDGPRGPAQVCGQAIAQLARFTGARVHCLGFAARGIWRLDSWDRLAAPLPWCGGAAVIGPPMLLERRADVTACKDFTAAVQCELERLRTQAQHLLEHGTSEP